MTRLVKPLDAKGILPHRSEASFLKKVDEVRADKNCYVPDEEGAKF
jgi:hypothetical protein